MEMLQGSPIRRRKLYEEVAERLAKAIADGNLQAGQPLPVYFRPITALQILNIALRLICAARVHTKDTSVLT